MRTFIAAAALCLAPPAFAQELTCAPREAVGAMLQQQFEEQPIARGAAPAPSGALFATEIWVNSESGTWTITMTRPDGIACLVAHGHNFNMVPTTPPGEEM